MKRVINFMGIRHAAFAVTVLLTLVSLGSLAVKGLNFGLDFTGGALIELNYEQPADLAKVRGQLAEAGYGDALVQHFGATTDVVVRLQGDDPQLGNRLAADLDKVSAEQFSVKRVEFVGPAVGEELRDQGGLGMLLALGGILIYVAFRFQWKFGFGAIVSLIHDVIVTLGVFSFFQIPFDLTVLAAVLALIGYSLNDTIVVFDRIREYLKLYPKRDLKENVNNAINSTLSRTINTSGTTLVTLLAIFFFGGETIRGFIFALTVGVIVGTVATIFIATPVAYDLMAKRAKIDKE